MVDRDQWHRHGYRTARFPAAGSGARHSPPDWPPRRDDLTPDGRPGAGWGSYHRPPRPWPDPQPARRRGRLDASAWHWLLFIPIVVPLIVPLYNRIEPTLGGVPFYYWGQLAFALLSSAVVTVVHLATKGR